MDVVQALGCFDPQTLSEDQLKHALEVLDVVALKVKATSLLQPAFTAESPGFQSFGRVAIQRLEALLQWVSITSTLPERAEVLRDLDVTSFIVCGLCLSRKTLIRLDKALFDEVVRQARGSSHRLINAVIASSKVIEAIRRSGSAVFNQNLNQLLQLRLGAQRPQTSLLLADLPSWYYSMPSRQTVVFGRLTAYAIGGAVSTYIPIRPEFADCLVRVVMNFNEALLKNLFGLADQEFNAERIHLSSAIKDQIGISLGDDVFEAVQASQEWALDADSKNTKCITADVFAGHSIVLDVTLGRKACVNFVNIAYGL